jgi:hypothetical protein
MANNNNLPPLQMGRIIYIVSNKDQKIIPAVVQEEILHRTMQGETLSYKVAVGPKDKLQIVDLSKIDGEVYTSLDEVRQGMAQIFQNFVNKMCDAASERAKQWYNVNDGDNVNAISTSDPADKINPSAFLTPENNNVSRSATSNNNQSIDSMLALRMPQQSSNNVPNASTKEILRQQLKEKMIMPEEIPTDGIQTVMPDGSVRNIKINMNGT